MGLEEFTVIEEIDDCGLAANVAAAAAATVVVINGVFDGVITSTGFLERFLPLCICLSQYFESGYASFAHLHFFPSVLLHLPGSGSTFLPKPI